MLSKLCHDRRCVIFSQPPIKSSSDEQSPSLPFYNLFYTLASDIHLNNLFLNVSYLWLPCRRCSFTSPIKFCHMPCNIDNHLPPFYREIIFYWQDIATATPKNKNEVLSQPIWNNRFLTANKKTVFFPHWHQAGIKQSRTFLTPVRVSSFHLILFAINSM